MGGDRLNWFDITSCLINFLQSGTRARRQHKFFSFFSLCLSCCSISLGIWEVFPHPRTIFYNVLIWSMSVYSLFGFVCMWFIY